MGETASLSDPALTASMAAVAEAEGEGVTAVLCGIKFTLRDPVPMGALAVFAARLGDKNPLVQAASYVRFLKAWIVPEQHDEIDDMVEAVADMSVFSEAELPKLVEAAAARPT